jgi:hypothetical protein
MKVWVVQEDHTWYDTAPCVVIEGVYATKELAEAACKKSGNCGDIFEFELQIN